MANIRKRGSKWQAQVRRAGARPVTRSFMRRTDAELWVRNTEAEIDRAGLPADFRQLRALTVGDLLRRYLTLVTPKKRSAAIETIRANLILRHPLSRLTLMQATPEQFALYRDERLAVVSGETARKDLSLLHHLFESARRDWSIPITSNPVAAVAKPPPSRPRDRRLSVKEVKQLTHAMRRMRNRVVGPMLRFALETGMRRGELLTLRWQDIDEERHIVRLAMTKNGLPRTVPLSTAARTVLSEVRGFDSERVFPTTAYAVRHAWQRLTRRAGIENLHFHDLRHEAVSRLFERGLNVPEVALISGHRDPRMLFRYTHLRPEDLVSKLG